MLDATWRTTRAHGGSRARSVPCRCDFGCRAGGLQRGPVRHEMQYHASGAPRAERHARSRVSPACVPRGGRV